MFNFTCNKLQSQFQLHSFSITKQHIQTPFYDILNHTCTAKTDDWILEYEIHILAGTTQHPQKSYNQQSTKKG